jgi:hypothetical protein
VSAIDWRALRGARYPLSEEEIIAMDWSDYKLMSQINQREILHLANGIPKSVWAEARKMERKAAKAVNSESSAIEGEVDWFLQYISTAQKIRNARIRYSRVFTRDMPSVTRNDVIHQEVRRPVCVIPLERLQ